MQIRTLDDRRKRVVIEGIEPQIDGGRFPIKRVVGEKVEVEADVFTDGHDQITCLLQYRKDDDADWQETPMEFLVNDRWRGEFSVQEPGAYLSAPASSTHRTRLRLFLVEEETIFISNISLTEQWTNLK